MILYKGLPISAVQLTKPLAAICGNALKKKKNPEQVHLVNLTVRLAQHDTVKLETLLGQNTKLHFMTNPPTLMHLTPV